MSLTSFLKTSKYFGYKPQFIEQQLSYYLMAQESPTLKNKIRSIGIYHVRFGKLFLASVEEIETVLKTKNVSFQSLRAEFISCAYALFLNRGIIGVELKPKMEMGNMLNAWEDENEERVLDFDSLRGYTVTNVEPRELVSWKYDEKRELPYLILDVNFTFEQEPDKTHLMELIRYHGEEEFAIHAIIIFYDGGWIHEDFYFDQSQIGKNDILLDLANQMVIKSKLPMLTSLTFAETPAFCADCKQPIEGWQAGNHGVYHCKVWSLQRNFGFVTKHEYPEMTYQQAKEQLKIKLQDANYRESVILQNNLSQKHIENIAALIK